MRISLSINNVNPFSPLTFLGHLANAPWAEDLGGFLAALVMSFTLRTNMGNQSFYFFHAFSSSQSHFTKLKLTNLPPYSLVLVCVVAGFVACFFAFCIPRAEL
jgi:hypothetical protein